MAAAAAASRIRSGFGLGPRQEGASREAGSGGTGPGQDWTAALELMIATNGADPYKTRVQELFPAMLQRIGQNGWSTVRALPYLDAGYKTQLAEAVKTYVGSCG